MDRRAPGTEALARAAAIAGPAPRGDDELHDWVRTRLGLTVPRRAVCPGHDAPFDYLRCAWAEPAPDLVVWAPRGGGKTRLAAAATLLDLLYRPGIQVRILAGSLEQSSRMWEHLWPDVQRLAGDLLEPGPSGRQRWGRVRLATGSEARVVAASQRAVRGLRVQRLRCDEVDVFDPAVWEAAQMVTRSAPGLRASVEAISTMQKIGGLMERVVEKAAAAAAEAATAGASAAPSVRILKWCLMEVLERCPDDRSCPACPLLEECGGAAKRRPAGEAGFLAIDDAIAIKRRISREAWEAEMLCRRPGGRDAVFPNFDERLHVGEDAGDPGPGVGWLAIDFGYHAPFACLWVHDGEDGVTRVLDEYLQDRRTLEEHLDELARRPWRGFQRIACDPAGNGRNDQTALSNVEVLRRRGYVVRTRSSRIVEGLEAIRAALRPAHGRPTLRIHPRCRRLIRALRAYRYGPGSGEVPLKDGVHDHPVDALRYYFVNRRAGGPAAVGSY